MEKIYKVNLDDGPFYVENRNLAHTLSKNKKYYMIRVKNTSNKYKTAIKNNEFYNKIENKTKNKQMGRLYKIINKNGTIYIINQILAYWYYSSINGNGFFGYSDYENTSEEYKTAIKNDKLLLEFYSVKK